MSPGVTGTLPVSNGGTGATSLTSGNVLVGGGTGAVTATKAAPSGAFVGTTDTQTLSAKRINPRSVAPAWLRRFDSDATDFYTVTGQNQNATFNNPTGTPVDGQKLMVRIKDDGTSRFSWLGFKLPSVRHYWSACSDSTRQGTQRIVRVFNRCNRSKWVCLASDAVGVLIMAITLVGSASAASNTVTMPAHQVGDMVVTFVYNRCKHDSTNSNSR